MLHMQAVTKVYRTALVETHALRSLDLHVREGEFVAVTGPSGSGKTTFLNIAGLLEHREPNATDEPRRTKAADARSRTKRRYRGFFFGRSQPSITVCRPRASESLPAGASRVITDPAPIVASRPTRTGATSDVFDPMNAPSSIVVTCLLAPS